MAGESLRTARVVALAAFVALFLLSCITIFPQRRNSSAPLSSAKSLVIATEPNAIIWIDDIRRGATDASGKLELKNVSPGGHVLRVRATGFKETSSPLIAGRRSVAIKLVRTTDQAELLFQQAEAAREKAKDDPSRQNAAELYRQAIQLRPAYPAAHLGLARVLLDLKPVPKRP